MQLLPFPVDSIANKMSCDSSTLSSVQAFDRTVPAGSESLVARIQAGKWRIFVESDRLVKIIIRQSSTLSNFAQKQIFVAANSAVEFQGGDPCEIFVLNESGADAKISTYDAAYLCGGLEPVTFAEDGLTTPSGVAWGAIGTNGGYPQPYCNTLRIYSSANFRIRAIDTSGNVVLNSGTQPVDESLVYSLDAPQNLKWEIREDVSSGTGIRFTAIWERK